LKATTALTFLTMALCYASVTDAAEIVLYDGTTPTTLPGTQGWVYVSNPFSGASATQTANSGYTTLDTTPDAAMSDMAGYFSELPFLGTNPNVPTLDNTQGYRVTWDVQIIAENHASIDRAGFSVIVISENSTKALEVAFWEDKIWVQDDTPNIFTQGEGVAYDTTAAMTRYELRVLGNNYDLLVDNTSILTGQMRDYTAFNSSPVPLNPGFPYDRSSFLFFGDNTGSGEAIVNLARISTFDSVPEPDADFDMDNDIDGRDFLTWQRGLGTSSGAMYGQGDANSNGIIDGEDLGIWEQQFGNVPPLLPSVASAAIPEPTTLALATIALLGIACRRRV